MENGQIIKTWGWGYLLESGNCDSFNERITSLPKKCLQQIYFELTKAKANNACT
jgi:hypothetical protein